MCISSRHFQIVRIPHRASSGISSTQKLQPRLVCAESQTRVGDFLRLGNDPIQPLEKSASKLLIRNEPNFTARGLQNFDAGRGERRRGWRKRNGSLNGLLGRITKSAGTRRNPREPAGSLKEKGQPRVVGLFGLVEAARIEHESAARPPHSFLHAYSGLCI